MSQAKVPSRAAIVDEFGEIERKMLLWRAPASPINPHAARHAELEQEIRSWHADLAGEESAVSRGKRYQVSVSPRGFKSTVTAAAQQAAFAVITAINQIDPFEIFTATIADMRTHCGAAFVKSHIPKEQTGPRTLTVVATHSASRAA